MVFAKLWTVQFDFNLNFKSFILKIQTADTPTRDSFFIGSLITSYLMIANNIPKMTRMHFQKTFQVIYHLPMQHGLSWDLDTNHLHLNGVHSEQKYGFTCYGKYILSQVYDGWCYHQYFGWGDFRPFFIFAVQSKIWS